MWPWVHIQAAESKILKVIYVNFWNNNGFYFIFQYVKKLICEIVVNWYSPEAPSSHKICLSLEPVVLHCTFSIVSLLDAY